MLLSFLSACSMTLPVQGSIMNSEEMFVGDATGYLEGEGEIRITSSHGRICPGNNSGRSGSGTFACSDGVPGTFTFNSTGSKGIGFGQLSTGERARFAFGNQASNSLPPW